MSVSASLPPVSPSAPGQAGPADRTPLTEVAPTGRTPFGDRAPVGPAAADDAGPTPAELLSFVQRAAADPELITSLPLDPDGRTWIRLQGPAGSEAWLIGWPPGTGTGWHDHGGSRGAFATAAGGLKEDSLAVRLPTEGWTTLELAEGVDRERELAPGDARAFGEHHVHEVRNESRTEHAVSVHAYYPPLPLMRRYSRTGAVLRVEQVEIPEEWM